MEEFEAIAQPDVFHFDEGKHVYTLNGRRMYGITTVLGVIAKPMLIPWAAGQVVEWIRNNAPKSLVGRENYYAVNNKMLEEAKIAHRKKKESAGGVGTLVHKLAEEYVNGTLAETTTPVSDELAEQYAYHEPTPEEVMVVKMFNNFLDWVKKYEVTFIASEQKMYSKKHWIAGTVDAVVMIKGKKYVMDIKTYSGIYDRTPFLQMAGYSIMLEEMGHDDIHGTIIVRLGKDGSFDVHMNTNLEEEKQAFLAALTLFKAMQNFKKKSSY